MVEQCLHKAWAAGPIPAAGTEIRPRPAKPWRSGVPTLDTLTFLSDPPLAERLEMTMSSDNRSVSRVRIEPKRRTERYGGLFKKTTPTTVSREISFPEAALLQ